MEIVPDFPHDEVLTCQLLSCQAPERWIRCFISKTHISGFITWLCHETMQKPRVSVNVLDWNLRLFSLVSSYVVSVQELCPHLPWNPFFNCLKIKWCQNKLISVPYLLLRWHWWQYCKRLSEYPWEVNKSSLCCKLVCGKKRRIVQSLRWLFTPRADHNL